jgi:hypothetical protein
MAHHPDMPRSELGLRKGGATRAPNSTVWGTDASGRPRRSRTSRLARPATRTSAHMG